MNLIDSFFGSRRSVIRKAFIPFATAGDPDLATTARAIIALAQAGASLVEVGFPFSDPVADGPVIQASYTRALARGMKLADLFAAIKEATANPALRRVPVIGMASYSLIWRRGPKQFVGEAQDAGFSGMIVPDLPLEEAADFAAIARERDFKSIMLVTPTTPRDRAAKIAAMSTGFLYVVSVTGITGERNTLPPELIDQLRWLRTQTTLPLCVGFGVSKPSHVAMLRDAADGVIVGSALVRKLAEIGDRSADDVIAEVQVMVRELVSALGA
ncbi:MAG: tryptophan synthase subunit alpha [Gemmataceae bacterium]